jgi:rubrerythrin
LDRLSEEEDMARSSKSKGRKRGGFSVKAVLRKAAAKERAAHRLYSSLAKNIDDASARGLLKDLAAEEKRHIKMVSDVAKGKKSIDEKITGAAADLHITEFLKPTTLSKRASFQEVLIYAMRREMQAIAAYTAMAAAVKNARIKKMCRFLAGQEKAHKLRLERFYDDVIYREN